MPHSPITLDMDRSLLVCGDRQVRMPSAVGALFLQALWANSNHVQGLTWERWSQQLQSLGHRAPDRTAMRRRLAEVARCLDALGCAGARPVVQSPQRGATVGPWQLRNDVRVRLAVLQGGAPAAPAGLACLTVSTPSTKIQLDVLRCFLVSDDLARNGIFTDAAANMARALALADLSPELRCLMHFRIAKYLRRAGQFANARTELVQVASLVPELGMPMQGAVQAEHAVQAWRLQYDDVAHASEYGETSLPTATGYSRFHHSPVDSRLMWQQFNIWASEWRRQMDGSDRVAVQAAFDHARRGYEAAIYWALASDDALNVMNVVANMGYLLQLSGRKKLVDRSVDALDWLLLSQAYIERFEWPEESLWDYVYLAELYLTSPFVRKHLKANSAYVMNALTPDSEDFYVHAIALGLRLGEPRQLADMHQLFIQFLRSTGQDKKAKAQAALLKALLGAHPGLREKMTQWPHFSE